MDMNKLYTILGTWSRAFIAAVIASYIGGNTQPKVILASGIAGFFLFAIPNLLILQVPFNA